MLIGREKMMGREVVGQLLVYDALRDFGDGWEDGNRPVIGDFGGFRRLLDWVDKGQLPGVRDVVRHEAAIYNMGDNMTQ